MELLYRSMILAFLATLFFGTGIMLDYCFRGLGKRKPVRALVVLYSGTVVCAAVGMLLLGEQLLNPYDGSNSGYEGNAHPSGLHKALQHNL